MFFKNHRNVKIGMILVCLMERRVFIEGERAPLYNQEIVYFQTKTFINTEETNEYDIINHMIEDILEKVDIFQMSGSGWYFKEVKRLVNSRS